MKQAEFAVSMKSMQVKLADKNIADECHDSLKWDTWENMINEDRYILVDN